MKNSKPKNEQSDMYIYLYIYMDEHMLKVYLIHYWGN